MVCELEKKIKSLKDKIKIKLRKTKKFSKYLKEFQKNDTKDFKELNRLMRSWKKDCVGKVSSPENEHSSKMLAEAYKLKILDFVIEESWCNRIFREIDSYSGDSDIDYVSLEYILGCYSIVLNEINDRLNVILMILRKKDFKEEPIVKTRVDFELFVSIFQVYRFNGNEI